MLGSQYYCMQHCRVACPFEAFTQLTTHPMVNLPLIHPFTYTDGDVEGHCLFATGSFVSYLKCITRKQPKTLKICFLGFFYNSIKLLIVWICIAATTSYCVWVPPNYVWFYIISTKKLITTNTIVCINMHSYLFEKKISYILIVFTVMNVVECIDVEAFQHYGQM